MARHELVRVKARRAAPDRHPAGGTRRRQLQIGAIEEALVPNAVDEQAQGLTRPPGR